MWGRPTEDDENPCYRPSGASVHGDSGVFTKLLERAVEEDGEERGLDLLHRNMEDDLDIISQSTMDTIYSISRPEGQHKRQLDAYTRSPAHIRSPGPSSYEEHLTYRLGRRTVVDSVLRAKRKRTSSGSSGYSDLHAPTKRERSSQAANDTSFVLSDKAEPIKTFFPKTGHSPSSDAYTPPSFDTQTQPNTRALEARIVALEGLILRTLLYSLVLWFQRGFQMSSMDRDLERKLRAA
ncbi:hypothetical protein PUNSTDRAFT_139022 [Punctularia strigosozonata HHB-11173 SS5]|uniref:Uncharacterized protein n=1 Tax=Punctularia strigosozonata (strain HHB-11173) TaxID=741275 RepID=R7S2H2_PUNST|nr:uncharacterized protein PUNSTDRAFT_139022 [Punctularia strigosozonata HHB-11173 SS5]EIN03982.1 hypothetical protein PUNSTDRAFT_139022 [Punctularia strigosozonata HHB-11173 SS5]